jgi:hypothetical protein
VAAGAVALALAGTLAGCGSGEPGAGRTLVEGQCTLSRSGRATGDEWGSCLQATVRLSRVPAVGETAAVSVEILGVRDGTVVAEVDLPTALAWTSPPPQLTIGTAPERVSDGCALRGAGQLRLRALEPVRLTGEVRAVSPGLVSVRARARAVPPGGGGEGLDVLAVTIGRTAAESREGHDESAGDAGTTSGPVEPCA